MHDGAGIAARSGRGDRLAFALEAGGLSIPAEGRVVVLNAAPSAFFGHVGAERVECEQPFRPWHERLTAEGLASAAALGDGPPAAAIVVVAPRQRAEALGLVARAFGLAAPGATIVIDGGKAEGIDGLIRQIAAVLPVVGTVAKAHGKVAWFTRPAELPETVAAWVAGGAARPNADGFVTAPGMFSPDHVDPGSARLAAQFDARLSGRVADLGAGWGWLAARALAGNPGIAGLDLYEADARALDAARCNVTDARASFHWADVTRLDRPGAPYDWVISNPPFHQGRAAEPALGIAFIEAAGRILKQSGRLLLVANRQLPYEAALARVFRSTTTLSEDAGYKVLLAETPLRGRPRR